MAHKLQEHDGKLNFVMDCWTSPNHRVFMAMTVHLEIHGDPLCILLDIIKIARSHSGSMLAEEFAGILENMCIMHKVSRSIS
jgi:hypothetical protein